MAWAPSPAREARAHPDAFFELGEFSREFPICFERFAQSNEPAHDGDVNFYGALTP